MNRALIVIVALLLVCCADRSNTDRTKAADQIHVATQSPTPSAPDFLKTGDRAVVTTETEIPPEFRDIDFKNFTYPITYNMAYAAGLRSHSVQLKDGKHEYPAQVGGTTYDLNQVTYTDLIGDGRKQAVVRLSQVVCGVSCDGGTDIFYFYATNRGRPLLLSRMEIGSYADECGLKSFILSKRDLDVETYRACKFLGAKFVPSYSDSEERGGKLSTNRYTKFRLYFDGVRFIQRERRVFKYPDDYDYRSNERKIEISN